MAGYATLRVSRADYKKRIELKEYEANSLMLRKLLYYVDHMRSFTSKKEFKEGTDVSYNFSIMIDQLKRQEEKLKEHDLEVKALF
ncbi:hypothetical protein [Sinobaca sp. H24]|uniref:hypothetical protein n=1 Tax=Sinobaca sp. H24 TaxID=2923376 RepID=UPI00207AD542|nr:hypothetical protein [Sinobaca sp. H24]